jgi:hypothetical protein
MEGNFDASNFLRGETLITVSKVSRIATDSTIFLSSSISNHPQKGIEGGGREGGIVG